MPEEEIWLWEEEKISDGTSNLTLYSPKVPTDAIVRVELAGCLIYEYPARYCFIGIEREGKIRWIKSSGTGATTQGVTVESPIYLTEGNRLVALVKNPVAGETFHVYANGVIIYKTTKK